MPLERERTEIAFTSDPREKEEEEKKSTKGLLITSQPDLRRFFSNTNRTMIEIFYCLVTGGGINPLVEWAERKRTLESLFAPHEAIIFVLPAITKWAPRISSFDMLLHAEPLFHCAAAAGDGLRCPCVLWVSAVK